MKNEKIYNYNFDDMGGRIIDQWGTYKRNKSDIVEKLKYNNEIYIFEKILEGTYNKAIVYQKQNEKDTKILMSYDTIVAIIVNGHHLNIFGYYSQTTARHINEFSSQNGFGTFSKKEIEKIATNKIYKSK